MKRRQFYSTLALLLLAVFLSGVSVKNGRVTLVVEEDGTPIVTSDGEQPQILNMDSGLDCVVDEVSVPPEIDCTAPGSGGGDITDVFDCASGNCGSIALSDGDLLDMSAVSVSVTTEGLILPQHATDCSTAGTAEGQVCWEADADTLYIGDGATVVQIGAGSGDITDVFDCASGNCASISLSDTDLLDMSAVSVSATTEGLILPQHATDCSAAGTAEGQVCWEADADVLYVGDGATVVKQGTMSSHDIIGDAAGAAAVTMEDGETFTMNGDSGIEFLTFGNQMNATTTHFMTESSTTPALCVDGAWFTDSDETDDSDTATDEDDQILRCKSNAWFPIGQRGASYGSIGVTGNSTATTITTQNVWVQITVFDTDGPENFADSDHTNDHILVGHTAVHAIVASISFTGGSNENYEFMVKMENGTADIAMCQNDREMSATATVGALPVSCHASLTSGESAELWVRGIDATPEDITISSANLSIQRIN